MSNFSSLKAAIQQYIKTNGNEEITGAVLQDILLSMVSVLGDTAINDLETALQTETTNRTNADGTLQQNITAEGNSRQQADTALGGRIDGLQSTVQGISTMLGEGYLYVGIATPSTNPGTPSGKVFYLSTAAGTYTYFGGLSVTQGITILKYNGTAWSQEQFVGIDNIPTAGSDNLVKSGGVYEKTVSVHNGLSDADIDVSDENGYVLLRLKQGGIKTKNFDSTKVPDIDSLEYLDGDLYITDGNGNALAELKNGHIVTKNFDSRYIAQNSNDIASLIYQAQNNTFNFEASKYFRRAALRMFPNYQPLIIVVGQSNADGRALYTTAPDWLAQANYKVPRFKVYNTATEGFSDYDVLGMTGNMGDPAGSDPDQDGVNKFAFDPIFAHQYLIDNPTKTLYMVRQTLGDTGIYAQPTTGRNWTWQPDIDSIVSGCKSMCVSLQDKLIKAYKAAANVGVTLIPIAILWHQGEKDTEPQAAREAYKQNLSNLISWFRGILFAPELPFINAYINGSYSANYAAINTIFDELAAVDPNMRTINMTGHYDMLPDNVHYNATGLIYMGEQMYLAYKSLI